VSFSFLNRADEAEALRTSLNPAVDAMAFPLDASELTAGDTAVAATIARFGRLDAMIVNAGKAVVGPLEDYPIEAFDDVFSLNVRSPFLASRAAASQMNENGRIIIIGSIMASRMPEDGGTLYAASKSALIGLVRGLARDLGPRGITANLVQPGPTDTERNPSQGPHAKALYNHLAIQRHAKPVEVAALVSYLASDAAAYVTGSVYNIDGGLSA
jgi:3-oxoacyl-[acyl-carrier protein] reductase